MGRVGLHIRQHLEGDGLDTFPQQDLAWREFLLGEGRLDAGRKLSHGVTVAGGRYLGGRGGAVQRQTSTLLYASIGPRAVRRGNHGMRQHLLKFVLQASIGPRPSDVETLLASPRRWSCQIASIGPRPVRRGNKCIFSHAQVLIPPSASIGPRPVRRGNCHRWSMSRLYLHVLQLGHVPVRRGNVALSHAPDSSSPLQLGHVPSDVETSTARTTLTGFGRASIGPRPVRRGNDDHCLVPPPFMQLQLGHVRSDVETRSSCPRCP